ncbi:MAG: DUF3822 family protein [Bacteroidia bacterium]|nr:DUF3822 family protein [Bacteroidia bacterium]
MLLSVDDQEKISLTDEQAFSVPAGSCSLHLLCRDGGWEAGLFHRTEQRWLGIHTGKTNDLSFNGPEWLHREHGSVSVSWVGRRFTFIPSDLFNDRHTEDYLNTGCGRDTEHKTFVVPMKHLPAQLIFGIYKDTTERIRSLWPRAEFHHQARFTVDPFLGRNKNSAGKKVQACMHENLMEIVVTEGNQLILYNVTEYRNPDEAAYHVMNAYEVLRLNPESVPVTLGGWCGKNSAVYALIFKYVRQVEHFPFPEDQQFSWQLAELPAYRFHPLFSQCAS